MLGNPKLRKVASLGTVAVGVVTLVAPKKAAVLGDKLSLSTRYETLGDGEFTPRDWYVDATRASGAGMIAAGLTGFALAARDDDAATDADAATVETDDDVDVAVETDDSELGDDGPVQIDLDDADDRSDDD
ncbi:hypothetical protein G9C85_10415 [Halorubellus sp. JP-L1]|uniref:hypothetical protein n=1 Tax=Halorubellus sp. JP-L1 TaxID=2715753 RepID=UPI00140DD9F6|nr:hypothetical protein [Halorubellus sp. JP-L1]NHN42039.1 hypothetical protein [Halorubellus sp. JP-L1]